MAKDFRIKDGENVRSTVANIATATVIEAGDLVTLSSGLIIKAVAASTAVAYAMEDHAANSGTEIEVSVGNDFTLVGTADAVFAVTNKGTEVDLVGTTDLLIDLGTSATDVLKVAIGADAGTVGATTNVEVRINKSLF
jgi:hypothetical protein